eukprot:g3225.t1
MAVEEHKIEWIEYFLNMIIEKTIQFCDGAKMINEDFKNLWIDYRTSIEPMLKKDVLGWDVCTIKVPLETFTVESNVRARVGTCNSVEEWVQCSTQDAAYEHWRELNKKEVDKILKTSRGRMVNASVRIYCFADVCRAGINGIIRFLLMSKAPSSIFKYPLIRWIIVYKWEKIWKVRAFKNLALYLVFFTLLNLTLLGIGFKLFDLMSHSDLQDTVISISVLMGTLALRTIWLEFFQLKRYTQDGQKIFPSSHFRGLKHYLASRQNQIDITLSISMLVFLPLYCLKRRDISIGINDQVFLSILAFVVLLMWAKALYLAQAFKRTGIFVLMIGRVLRECLPYFFMLVGFMIGFGFTMHIALLSELRNINDRSDSNCYTTLECSNTFYKSPRYSYHHGWYRPYYPRSHYYDGCDHYSDYIVCYRWNYYYTSIRNTFTNNHECITRKGDDERIVESFNTPFRSILTMAYAMVGLFDPEILFKTGNLSNLVITLFVLYLALQTIVMFNMLIAAMGDAFDGVRAAEEESFLMARAEFIDQYEASLSNDSIKAIEEKIGRYLYVLIPGDKQLEKSVPFWKGRMTTIKEDVRKIVRDSHEDIAQKIDQLTQRVEQQMENEHQFTQNMDRQNQDICQLTQNMNQLTQNINEMFARLKNDAQSFRGEIKSLEEKIKTLEK